MSLNMDKPIRQILEDADDGQEECEPVHLTMTLAQAQYLLHLVKEDAEK